MKSNYFFIYLMSLFVFSGCFLEKDEPSYVWHQEDNLEIKNHNNDSFISNWELIYEPLQIYLQNKSLNSQYWCSEIIGGYTSVTYVSSGAYYYLNQYYQDYFGDPNARNHNIQTMLNTKYHNQNASGTYSVGISMEFDIYGFNGGVYTDATNTNRILNEVNCLINYEIQNSNLPPPSSKKPITNIYFVLDYYLCCTGTTCCDPVLSGIGGTIFWD